MAGHMIVNYMNSLPDVKVFFTSRNKLNKKAIYLEASNFGLLEEIIKDVKPNLVVNSIGIINKLVEEKGEEKVVLINSYLPHKLANICKMNNSKLIHLSTDCVFSGKKGMYTEQSNYSPTDFYGRSKALGEVNDPHNLTIRTSIIGPEIKRPKNGLFEWFLSQKGKDVEGYTNVIWSGVTTLELSKQIINLYREDVSGLINLVSKPISKYFLLNLIKDVYGLNVLINPNNDLRCNRSMKSLRNVKYFIPSHEQMLIELKKFYEKNV